MEQNKKFKCCDVYVQDIHRNSFAQLSKTINPLLKTGDKLRFGTCKLVIKSSHDFRNPLLTGKHVARAVLAVHKRRICFEASKEDFTEYVYEHFLRSLTHINNFDKFNYERRRCETCNAEFGRTI